MQYLGSVWLPIRRVGPGSWATRDFVCLPGRPTEPSQHSLKHRGACPEKIRFYQTWLALAHAFQHGRGWLVGVANLLGPQHLTNKQHLHKARPNKYKFTIQKKLYRSSLSGNAQALLIRMGQPSSGKQTDPWLFSGIIDSPIMLWTGDTATWCGGDEEPSSFIRSANGVKVTIRVGVVLSFSDSWHFPLLVIVCVTSQLRVRKILVTENISRWSSNVLQGCVLATNTTVKIWLSICLLFFLHYFHVNVC